MIHYKETNPGVNDNLFNGYTAGDYWVNIVTYTKYQYTEDDTWVWKPYDGSEMTQGGGFSYPIMNPIGSNVEISTSFNEIEPGKAADATLIKAQSDLITSMAAQISQLEQQIDTIENNSVEILIDN